MAKKSAKKQEVEEPVDIVSALLEMKKNGKEVELPNGRRMRLRAVDSATLLRQGKVPDILTPMVVKSVYQDLSDNELRRFVENDKGSVTDAVSMLDALDFIAQQTIADNTKVEDLTIREKRWIFRLVMGAAELLATFRLEPASDVADLDEGDTVLETTE